MSILSEILVPKESVADEYATVVQLIFKNGDFVKHSDEIAVMEMSKAIIGIEAGVDGYIDYLCKVNDKVKVGSKLACIHDEVLAPACDGMANTQYESRKDGPVFSKAAQALIERNNLNRRIFKGFDFVTEKDVFLAIGETGFSCSPVETNDIVLNDTEQLLLDDVELHKLPPTKMTEIENLTYVQSACLNSTVSITVDIDLTSNNVDCKPSHYGPLLPLIIFHASRLLKVYSKLNAYFKGDSIAYYKKVNIGFAVDLDEGLKVLKIPKADVMSLEEVEMKMFDLVRKYMSKSLYVEDVTGTTFTITDLSSTCANFFIPLINARQSAVLGVCSVDHKLKEFGLTLTFDHRVTEGKYAATFLRDLKKGIEEHISGANYISSSKSVEVPVDLYPEDVYPDAQLIIIQRVKEILSRFLKTQASEINHRTVMEKTAFQGSISLHRMYADLDREGFKVKNPASIHTFGDLLLALGIESEDSYISQNDGSQTKNFSILHKRPNSNVNGLAVGIDITNVCSMPDVEDFGMDEFYKRNFSNSEIAYCTMQQNPLQCFAGKFAAKEAIVKADNTFKNISFKDIQIINIDTGQPSFEGFSISISHTDNYAIAIALNTKVLAQMATNNTLLASAYNET